MTKEEIEKMSPFERVLLFEELPKLRRSIDKLADALLTVNQTAVDDIKTIRTY